MPDDHHDATLGGDRLETWSTLATLLEWLPPALDKALQPSGLTHFEYGMLYALEHAPGHSLRLRVLAEYANSGLPRLSRALDRLEKRGWVRREPDPEDGRSTLAVLLPAGHETLRQAAPIHETKVKRRVSEQLTPTQATELRESCRRILSVIREEEGWRAPSVS